MAGTDLIFSSICNGTVCDTTYNATVINFYGPKKTNYLSLFQEINGKHLRIGTYENYPLNYINRDRNDTLEGLGVAFVILNILQMKFNFTYEVVVPKKNRLYGGGAPEDTLIGLINSSQVDMAVAFIPKLKPFQKLVQFSRDLDEGTWFMLLKRPSASATGSGLMAPFDRFVWYMTLAAVLAYGPCITFLTRLRSKLVRDKDYHLPLSPSFWFVYSAFIKQGTSLSPEANVTRILFATWWLFIILLSAFYTANLTAFLTLSKFTLDINGPQDLIAKNYRWTAVEGGSVQYVVENPDENLYYLNKMVRSGRAEFKAFDNIYKYLEFIDGGGVLVKESVSVFHMTFSNYIEKAKAGFSEVDRCNYVIAPVTFMAKTRGFAYPKGSSLHQLFDPTLNHIFEGGFIRFHKQERLPRMSICPLDLQSKDRQLQNSDLVMTYLIMLVGVASATAVFIAEVAIKRYWNRNSEVIEVKTSKRSSKTRDESKPPPYDSLFSHPKYNINENTKRKIINGREYYVCYHGNGDTRLIPIRTPSAFLYR